MAQTPSDNRQRMENTLCVSEAATMLHLSAATIRNWVKSGFLPHRLIAGKQVFYVSEIYDLQTKLQNGNAEKLQNRANKTHSDKSFFPKEYLQNKSYLQDFTSIITFIQTNGIPTSMAMFLLSLNYLHQEKMIQSFTYQDVINQTLIFTNKQLEIEINDWFSSFSKFSKEKDFSYLLHCSIPAQKDVLGFLYQSLMKEGTKSQQGAYYTPEEIVNGIVSTYIKADSKVLDPCCGTGQFLLAFARKISNPRLIYGMDMDEIAVRIARINLFIAYKTHVFVPNIMCKNTLLDSFQVHDFDVVASNPPWGCHFSESEKETIKKIYPEITSMESFALFLKKSMDLTHKGGVVSFILPESILKVKMHKDIRTLILNETKILKIKVLGRIFTNVFSPIIRLDIKKDKTTNQLTEIEIDNRSYTVDTSIWKNNKDQIFTILSDECDKKLLNKIYAISHTTLYKQADWALGIVTGNNRAYLADTPKSGYKPIYRGSDILPLHLKPSSHYLLFVPEKLQQTAPMEKYEANEKLIYRFISKKIIVAYDDKQRLTLNSANCVLPKISNYSLKIIALLFNSSLYQYIFQKKFSSIKVLRSHLEQLPLPLLNAESYQQLEILYNGISEGKKTEKEIDSYIMSLFGLTNEEQQYIRDSIK